LLGLLLRELLFPELFLLELLLLELLLSEPLSLLELFRLFDPDPASAGVAVTEISAPVVPPIRTRANKIPENIFA
jgi:hypothetical protein